MQIEKDYTMLPTTDGRFVLAIEAKETPVEDAHIIYAKGKHAILYRNKNQDDAVILDFLPNEAQKLMSENKRAVIIELKNGKPYTDYIAEIQIKDKLPIQLKEK